MARARRARCFALRLRRPGRAAALPHPKYWGLEQELHLRPSPYEGAALTAAPSSQDGGPPRYCPEFCRLRGGGFTVKACDPKKWWSLRVSHPPEFLPARETTTLRSPRPRMAAAGGLAPPFTDSKSAVLLIRRHRNESGQGDRTCTCMISLPTGVADYLAPHPDVEIEPARRRTHSGPVLVFCL